MAADGGRGLRPAAAERSGDPSARRTSNHSRHPRRLLSARVADPFYCRVDLFDPPSRPSSRRWSSPRGGNMRRHRLRAAARASSLRPSAMGAPPPPPQRRHRRPDSSGRWPAMTLWAAGRKRRPPFHASGRPILANMAAGVAAAPLLVSPFPLRGPSSHPAPAILHPTPWPPLLPLLRPSQSTTPVKLPSSSCAVPRFLPTRLRLLPSRPGLLCDRRPPFHQLISPPSRHQVPPLTFPNPAHRAPCLPFIVGAMRRVNRLTTRLWLRSLSPDGSPRVCCLSVRGEEKNER